MFTEWNNVVWFFPCTRGLFYSTKGIKRNMIFLDENDEHWIVKKWQRNRQELEKVLR